MSSGCYEETASVEFKLNHVNAAAAAEVYNEHLTRPRFVAALHSIGIQLRHTETGNVRRGTSCYSVPPDDCLHASAAGAAHCSTTTVAMTQMFGKIKPSFVG